MKWTRLPDCPGVWLFTHDLKDWDIYTPLGVSQSENGSRTVFTVHWVHRLPRELKQHVKEGQWELEICPTFGWWFGPFRVERPDEKNTDLIVLPWDQLNYDQRKALSDKIQERYKGFARPEPIVLTGLVEDVKQICPTIREMDFRDPKK